MSARARSRVTLRKMLVQFPELNFAALECQICATHTKVQPAQPSLQMSSAFFNAGGAHTAESRYAACYICNSRADWHSGTTAHTLNQAGQPCRVLLHIPQFNDAKLSRATPRALYLFLSPQRPKDKGPSQLTLLHSPPSSFSPLPIPLPTPPYPILPSPPSTAPKRAPGKARPLFLNAGRRGGGD